MTTEEANAAGGEQVGRKSVKVTSDLYDKITKVAEQSGIPKTQVIEESVDTFCQLSSHPYDTKLSDLKSAIAHLENAAYALSVGSLSLAKTLTLIHAEIVSGNRKLIEEIVNKGETNAS